MARDGAGNYNLPAGNPVVTNTTITSSWANGTLTDVGTALTQSLSKDGQTAATGNLPMGGFHLTGLGNGTARTDSAAIGQVQDEVFVWGGTASGTAAAMSIITSPATTAYVAGQVYKFIAVATNTGALTLAVNGLAATAVTQGGSTPLVAGDVLIGQVVEVVFDGTRFQLLNPASVATGSVFRKNVIINGNFAVNQRVKSGSVVLAAGIYGHDRWKAGASGCTYTFATSANVTTITISAGSLMQTIEGADFFSGTHTLSWGGTAQGKIGAGSYSATGVTGALTGGTDLTVEFNTGTLSKVQLEAGSVATNFEYQSFGDTFARCRRYARMYGTGVGDVLAMGMSAAASPAYLALDSSGMRATATFTHNLTNAAYVGTVPGAGQWALYEPAIGYCAKTGTVVVGAVGGSPTGHLVLGFTGATWSVFPAVLQIGSGMFMLLDAEL